MVGEFLQSATEIWGHTLMDGHVPVYVGPAHLHVVISVKAKNFKLMSASRRACEYLSIFDPSIPVEKLGRSILIM